MGHWHGVERRHADRGHFCWPVVVEVGGRRYDTQTVDVGSHGSKIRLPVSPELGKLARLRLNPDDERPLDVDALVWREDVDGVAFFFLGVREYTGEPAEDRLLELTAGRAGSG